MMHWLITYPRSGTDWTRRRMKLLLKLFKQRGVLPPGVPIKNSHLGFNPPKGVDGTGNRRKHIKPNDHLHVLLRDGRKSVVSTFFFLYERICDRNRETFHRKYGKFDVNSYVRSGWGATRFVLYLNRLQEYKENGYSIDFRYYEDIGTREFIYEIPSMLGLTITPTEEEVERVYNEGKRIVNLVGADHSTLSLDSAKHIQETIEKGCRLQEYRDRYLCSDFQ
jgi:hypothetical protein